MTEGESIHHQEQMEAAREEFKRLWDAEVFPHLPDFNRRSIVAAQTLAWRIYLKSKGLRRG